MSETPGTSTDPALGTEGDDDQLTREDALLDSPVDDVLDEGYSPPERDRSNRWGETAYEESVGEPLERRLGEEEPEVWEADYSTRRGRESDRSGRIEDTSDGWRRQDAFARDAGISGGAASAEEAAMHTLDDDAEVDELGEDEEDGAGAEESRER
ncbi:conserved hypothetical protein [Beutenbergia cavernae DSM 12333]|uniref:DUF5709 domain-containing protein n=1 Tax=Beutenbergia cavernae (strain ATCC BAA-8 / DSM 12333 / CCUG 43141 / JCM 11478 / NBRC 16432 / NCIMB 13614 / HKI 0122) TaxID=471853 RepID=C5C0F5_BEUC1|nr:DUF5709 domain-containing protein [Beutenbergia cavernae]ACQ81351.1 conserved hypothetical protein [Beutenbergia cavernae DSM 12333]